MRTLNEIADSSWIGTFPKKWNMLPIKSLFNFSKGLNITKEDLTDNGSKVISYGQIHAKDNNKTGIHSGMVRYVPKEKTLDAKNAIVHKGGFIFADTSEDLDGVGNCAYNDSDKEIFGGYHTIVLNPIKDEDNKYFAYLFQTDAWRTQLRRQLVDVKVFSVNQGILSETYLIIPPKLEQEAIVSYLDFHCKNIDESIKRHQAIIDKLETYRSNVITQAVTRGIGANATYKKSEHEYLREIPLTWEEVPLKYICTYNIESLSEDTDPQFSFDYVDIGSVSLVNGIENKTRMNFGEAPSRARRLVRSKDIIISTVRTYLKAIAIIPSFSFPLVVSTGFLVVRAKDECVLPEYLGFTLKSDAFTKAVEARSVGVSYPAIKASEAVKIFIAIPPISEQREIATYLEKKCSEIDRAINSTKLLITKLKEYRQSLIYQAVTGKISCTGGAL